MSDPNWNLTLLAPTDEAFAALPDGVLAALREDPTTWTRVLDEHHAVDSVLIEPSIMDDLVGS